MQNGFQPPVAIDVEDENLEEQLGRSLARRWLASSCKPHVDWDTFPTALVKTSMADCTNQVAALLDRPALSRVRADWYVARTLRLTLYCPIAVAEHLQSEADWRVIPTD
jgi:hypothetical protein